MAGQVSQNLSIFFSEFLHANTWAQRKDGVPLELLDKLAKDELITAEKELISAAGLHDTWPIRGLGHIRSTTSLSKLYDLLAAGEGIMRVFLAHAIYLICQDEKMTDIAMIETSSLIKRLPRTEFDLIDAIYLLPDFQNGQLNELLTQLCGSKHSLIAYNAARALGRPTENE